MTVKVFDGAPWMASSMHGKWENLEYYQDINKNSNGLYEGRADSPAAGHWLIRIGDLIVYEKNTFYLFDNYEEACAMWRLFKASC